MSFPKEGNIMKLTTKKTVLILITSIGLAIAPSARAAHATNFLNALQTEVTNRIANTNLPAAQQRALASANKSLSRNTKTPATDLIALSTAANALDKQFPADSTFAALEDDALDAYSDEAHAQLDNAALHLGTNSITKGLSNQLAKIRVALTNAGAITNGVPAKARALANVFNRMNRPVAKILQQFPTVPFEAPLDIATGQSITLSENAPVNEQTKFFFHTIDDMSNRYLSYSSDNPAEVGVWTYERLTTKTAVLHCMVTISEEPGGSTAPHDMALTFTSATGGTFTGRTTLLENIAGTFSLE
jgi:hypothetical protein